MQSIITDNTVIVTIDGIHFVVIDGPFSGTPIRKEQEIERLAEEQMGVYVVHYLHERAWFVDGLGFWNGEIVRHNLKEDNNDDEKLIIKMFKEKDLL